MVMKSLWARYKFLDFVPFFPMKFFMACKSMDGFSQMSRYNFKFLVVPFVLLFRLD